MAKTVTDDMFDDIVKSGGVQFFRHTEEEGEVEVVFTTGIAKVDPGDTDLLDREWEPPTHDANGMPLLDWNGKVKEPWTKFEAKCLIKGVPHLYSFGGEKSSILRNFAVALKQNELSSNDLPGTKWSIERIGSGKSTRWNIQYLGKEDVSEETEPQLKEKPKESDDKSDSDVKSLLVKYKKEYPDKAKDGISKNSIIQYIVFETELKPTDAEAELSKLVEDGFVKEENGKITY